jgi:hypothetical protein
VVNKGVRSSRRRMCLSFIQLYTWRAAKSSQCFAVMMKDS